MNRTSGLTLVELMITSAIIGIGVLAAMGSYRYISTSIQHSKGRTLGTNLATEQVEKLKNLQYYALLVTTSTYYTDTRFTPSLVYDLSSYPPEDLVQGGIAFRRGTRVDFAYQNGTAITTTTWTANDTGLKLVSVYVIWQDESGLRFQEIHNLMADPADPLTATFDGTVVSTGGAALAGVMVKTIDNPNYYDTTDATGHFEISVASGNYTLYASSTGYFSSDKAGVARSGVTTTVPFTLSHMAPGSATGKAYITDHLVISQIVASTGPSNNIEYFALYNPTTAAIYIGDNVNNGESGHAMPAYVPAVWQNHNASVQLHRLHYVTTSVPSHASYLISNTGDADPAATCAAFVVAGFSMQPDACWSHIPYDAASNDHAIDCGGTCPGVYTPDAGGIAIVKAAGVDQASWSLAAGWIAFRTDSMGWNQKAFGVGNNAPSDSVEGSGITPLGIPLGLVAGEILGRMTDPGFVTSGYGMTYDTNDNSANFLDRLVIPGPPGNSSITNPPLTGTPAAGAYVTANDPLSSPVQVDSLGNFNLPNIATGTWTLVITSGTYYYEMSNLQIAVSASTAVPNGATLPAWPGSGYNHALLQDTTSCAFVSGTITDITNAPLADIQVMAGGTVVNTASTGRYFAATSTGDVLVVANYNNSNKFYASQSSTILGATVGQFVDNPLGSAEPTSFQLPQTGTIVGYFQNASLTALPGQTAVARIGGNQVAQAVSDNSGHFYLRDLSTGTYDIAPALDPMSTVSPTVQSITITAFGTAASVSTFTVSSGLAEIRGNVTVGASHKPISTGVLLLASSSTISGSMPPSLDGGLGSLCAPCYYGGSSDSTGQYTLYVRSSTTPYHLYGWYTTIGGSVSSTTIRAAYPLTVSSPGSTVHQDLVW